MIRLATFRNEVVRLPAELFSIDGMRCDIHGNLWCGWGMGSEELDGVMAISPRGKLIGRIALPERGANLCFGGSQRNPVSMASCQPVYTLHDNTQGAVGVRPGRVRWLEPAASPVLRQAEATDSASSMADSTTFYSDEIKRAPHSVGSL
jgi:hypothetical protein